jgi:hypothetical protein
MKEERIYLIALIVLAVLASIKQVPVDAAIWAGLLAIVGIIGGVMVSYPEVTQRLLIYAIAAVLPIIDNTLDAVWVIGPWFNIMLDNMALGIQGLAVGMFVMALIGRLQGSSASS